MSDDLRAELEQSAAESSSRYPDWWDPDDLTEGDELQGEVADIRRPFDDDSPVMEVETDDGERWSTRPHASLTREIEGKDVAAGDMVLVTYEGEYETETGGMGYSYTLGVVHADELRETRTEDI